MDTTHYDAVEADEDWSYDFTLRGSALLDALPNPFSFDDLMSAADRLAIPSQEAVEHLRIMQRERFVVFERERFTKPAASSVR